MMCENTTEMSKDAVKQKQPVNAASARLNLLMNLRRKCVEIRERYRNDGTPNHERRQAWNRITLSIGRLDAKIAAAETDEITKA